MKLLKNQYQDILNVLQESGMSIENFTLTKKKGRIKIQVSGEDSFFEFFRRKSVALDEEDHQWRHSEHYELTSLGRQLIVAEWHEVMSKFKEWVDALPRQIK